jgi:transcriptional regulator with XRE-family HTH domain
MNIQYIERTMADPNVSNKARSGPKAAPNPQSSLRLGDNGRHTNGHAAGELVSSLGESIRQARTGRHSIEELAALSGVSSGRISQIERGLANPSFSTIWKLASALDIPLGTFFSGEASEYRKVVRRDQRKKLFLPHDDLVYELLTPDLQGRLEVFLFHVPAGFDNSNGAIRHSGEEFIHILSGSLEVNIGSESFELLDGDSITYDAGQAHFVRNTSSRKAVALAAVTPPSF